MKIAVIGKGWVGKSMIELFPDSVIYDEPLGIGTKEEVNACDVAFICVPTPCPEKGRLDTSIVFDVAEWCECPLKIVRSTVNPGDCEQLPGNIVFQPEYLGETPAHPMLHPVDRPFIILGGHPENVRKVIDLYATVYNANTTIRQTSLKEAEIIKLSENRAIAFKVAQCQELYDACEAAGVNYYTIRDAVYGDDPRFNLWWTFIYPDKRGFNSKCIPKDIYAWQAWAESVGADTHVTRHLLKRNEGLING